MKELTTMQWELSLSNFMESCYILAVGTLPEGFWQDLGVDRKYEVGVRHVRLRRILVLKTWFSQRPYEKIDQRMLDLISLDYYSLHSC